MEIDTLEEISYMEGIEINQLENNNSELRGNNNELASERKKPLKLGDYEPKNKKKSFGCINVFPSKGKISNKLKIYKSKSEKNGKSSRIKNFFSKKNKSKQAHDDSEHQEFQKSTTDLERECQNFQTAFQNSDANHKKLQTDHKNLQTDYENLQTECQNLQTKCQDSEKFYQKLQTDYKNLQTNQKLQDSETNNQKLQTECQNLKTKCQDFEKNYQKLQTDYKYLQTNYQKLQTNHQNLQGSETNYQKLQTDYQDLQTNYQKLQTNHQSLQGSETNYQKLQTDYQYLQTNLQNLQKTFQDSEINYQNLQTKCQDSEKNYQKLQTDYQYLQTNHQSLQDSEKNYQKLQTDYQDLQTNHQNLQKSFQDSEINYQNLQTKCQDSEINYQKLQTDYQNLQTNYQELQQNPKIKSPNSQTNLEKLLSQKDKEIDYLTKTNGDLKKEAIRYQSALGDATSFQLGSQDSNSPGQLAKDIRSLHNNLDKFCGLKKGIDVNESEVKKLLEKFGCSIIGGKIRSSKNLISGVLERHVIETIIEKTKNYFENDKDNEQNGKQDDVKQQFLEVKMVKTTGQLLNLTDLISTCRAGTDKVSKATSTKLRQQIYGVLGNRGFSNIVANERNENHPLIATLKKEIMDLMNRYRTIKNSDKLLESEKIIGEIVKQVVSIFFFRLKVQEPVAEWKFFENKTSINTIMMDASLDEDELDNLYVDVCAFPIIGSDLCEAEKADKGLKVIFQAQIITNDPTRSR